MRLIVQKYGGTSVGDAKRIHHVAQRLIETQRQNCRVVGVISAMAGVTDNLIKLAHSVSPQPTPRELDLLLATGENAATAIMAMAVNALGARAISLSGAEAGILTDRLHTKAKIANISPRRIQNLLDDDYIELLGVLTQTELNAPSRAFLARTGGGIERIAFTTLDAAAGAEEIRARGYQPIGPTDFERPVTLPGDRQSQAKFRQRKLLKQAVGQHRSGATALFLRRLPNQHHGAMPAVF